MTTSRFNRKSWERLLYIATGLVILVILSDIMWVLPIVIRDEAPGAYAVKAVPLYWMVAGIHVILLGALIRKIYVSRHGGRLRKTRLFISGGILILVSMLLLDAAGACLEHQPDLVDLAIALSIGAICDMISGIITIMLPIRLPDNQKKTYM